MDKWTWKTLENLMQSGSFLQVLFPVFLDF